MKIPKNVLVLISGLIVIMTIIVWFSVRDNSIMKQEALQKIQALPEVQQFIAELEKNGKAASFNVEDSDNAWSVQVYEIVVQNGESHTATFNWYKIDKKSGDVTKEFE
ncbi:MAG: hypothetical protein HYT12_04615 [Candidatus Liptonbacteria bacterium]|nr:hypothetical protein [Candidatus Liptonbacteria bacterium]